MELPGRLVPLRPLTVSDILDLVFQTLRRAGGPVAVIVLAVLLPELLLRELATFRFTRTATIDPTDIGAAFAGFGWVVVSALVGLYVGLVISAAIVALLAARDRGATLGVWGGLRIGLARSGATVGASVLTMLGVTAASFVALVIGIVFAVVIPFAGLLLMVPIVLFVPLVGFLMSYLLIAVAVEEGVGPWHTLTRTVTLLRRGFWRAVLITLLLGLLTLAVGAGLFALGGLIAAGLGELGWVLQVLGGGLFSAISTPLFAAAGLILYRDLRVRGEAYDLRVRARALRGAPR